MLDGICLKSMLLFDKQFTELRTTYNLISLCYWKNFQISNGLSINSYQNKHLCCIT